METSSGYVSFRSLGHSSDDSASIAARTGVRNFDPR